MKCRLLTLLTLVLWAGCSSSTTNTPPGSDAGSDAEAGLGTGGDGGPDASTGGDGGGSDGGRTGGDGGGTDGGGSDGGGTDGGGTDGGSTGSDGGGTDGGLDVNACEDPAIECGEVDIGITDPLDCGDPLGNPTGTEKKCELYETCVANKCTCEKELGLPDSPECGTANQCEDGYVELGNCTDQGGNYICTSQRKCECTRTPKSTACAAVACGDVADGCGGTWTCGCQEGQTCNGTGGSAACECDAGYDSTAFCAGKCGEKLLNGCVIDCGSCTGDCPSEGASCADCQCIGAGEICGTGDICCTATAPATLCAGTCGQVTDPCTGEVIDCTCGGGKGCVNAAYVRDSSVDLCLPDNIASLAGKYAVRTHAFSLGASDVIRSEVISLVTITTNAAGDALEMTDQGCVATTDNGDSGTGRQRAVTVGYAYLDDEYHPVEVSGDSWIRQFARNATPPDTPNATGWIPHMPSYCADPDAGAPTDGPGPGNGPDKPWLTETCTCPDPSNVCDAADLDPDPSASDTVTARFSACRPAQNTSSDVSKATDCRINDDDNNGLPGITLVIEGGAGSPMQLHVGTVGDIQWSGTIDPNGSHSGIATEPVDVLRVVFACNGSLCGLAGGAQADSCGASYNAIRFTRLVGAELDYECSDFYVPAVRDGVDALAASFSDIDTTVYEPLFKKRGVRCAGNTDCPCTSNADCSAHPGTLCHDDDGDAGNGVSGFCWPVTSPGACAGGGSCPSGWSCRSADEACWPPISTNFLGFDTACGT